VVKDDDIYVAGRGCLTPAGFDFAGNWRALARGIPALKPDAVFGVAGRLAEDAERRVEEAAFRAKPLRHADRAVRFGAFAAREAWAEARLDRRLTTATVIGSSRGATQSLEGEHERFLERGRTSAHASPSTTAGSFASVVAQDLGLDGPNVAVSSACATGLVAIGTAFALLKAGLADQAIAGGSEASLTPFTKAQLEATGVLAKAPSILFPSRPMHPERSGMIAAEGAACLALATGAALERAGGVALARIAGFGAATEPASATGISDSGSVLVAAVRRAVTAAALDPMDIDLVVGHGAGTLKGDAAEQRAYETLFGEGRLPPMTFHKWLTGHMIGASAACSAAFATQHLLTGEVPALPYFDEADDLAVEARYVLVTALGFGGVAAALVLARD
jgi:3-oxoacyl-(acyl-carrier-protein) synthase